MRGCFPPEEQRAQSQQHSQCSSDILKTTRLRHIKDRHTSKEIGLFDARASGCPYRYAAERRAHGIGITSQSLIRPFVNDAHGTFWPAAHIV